VKLGSQTAIQTSVPGNPGPGSPGAGQGFIYYILSSAAAGAQTLTFTASGGASQTQVSYIDFTPTAGCTFSHDIDSPVGSYAGSSTDINPGTISAPSIAPSAGDVLFNFTWTSEHVNSVNSPWSCPIYSGAGETQTCEFNTTINAAAYILNAPSGSTANNMTDIHNSDSWQGLITSFSLSGSGSVTGNGCPSSAPVTGNHCYFIAANGSDTNSGGSESSPWLHAPGMANCTGNCAAHTPVAGEGFIFRGGDTWHFGNSSASPYTGSANCVLSTCGWHLNWSGSSGNPIYFGVDKNWFAGSSWTRPILNGDNPTSTSAVASCAHDDSNFTFVQAAVLSNITLDNFEFTGLCHSSHSPSAFYVLAQQASSADQNRTFSNLAFHGWTHTAFNCSGGGTCSGGTGISGPTDRTFGKGDIYSGIVCDGADSDNRDFFCIFGGGYDIHNSVFRYNGNGVVINNMHVFHDNLIEYIASEGDGVAHSNGFEFNDEFQAANAIYNNVIRHMWRGGLDCGEVSGWESPHSTDYVFNNLQYDNPCGGINYWNLEIGLSGDAGWTANVFNNTFIISADNPVIAGPPGGTTVNFLNNQCVTPSGGTPAQCSSYQGTENYTGSINQSSASAALQGYTASQAFAYSPPALSGATVGKGSNQMSLCSALTGSGDALLQVAGIACQSDTRYACTYNSSNYTVTCPSRTAMGRPSATAWDVGTYQFSTVATGPNPPSGLIATVN
jgi:hypothetical protein